MSSLISFQTLAPWNIMLKILYFVVAFGIAQVILEDNLVLYLSMFLPRLKKVLKTESKSL